MKAKLCPIVQNDPKGLLDCGGDQCKWYDEYHLECGLILQLSIIGYHLKRIADLTEIRTYAKQ